MGFFEAVGVCFSKYAVWSGRARRSEYWWFALFCLIVSFIIAMIDAAVFPQFISSNAMQGGPFSFVFTLVTFLPSLGVLIRRLHDLERSGWWFWLVLIPIVGWIVLFVFMVSEGTRGRNYYGEDPVLLR